MLLDDTKTKMQAVIQAVQEDLNTIRVGKATPAMIDQVVVQAYGGTQQLKVMELGSIQATDAQTLVINPWDKSVIGEINKAINSANLGFTAVIDGEIIRIQLPPITEQRRLELIKMVSTKLENGKVKLRQIRHEKLNEVRKSHKEKEISDDDKFNLEKELQKIIDEHVAEIDAMGDKKEQELKQI